MAACAGRPGTDRPAGIREMGRGKLATPGVRVRTAQSIEIDFYYRGVRCRERLKLAPNTANRRYASRLKGRNREPHRARRVQLRRVLSRFAACADSVAP